MEKNIIVAPSVLAADFGNLEAEMKSAEQAQADILHLDIMDGNFVPPISFGANMVQLAKRVSSLPLEVHLMTLDPRKYFEDCVKAGADRILIHQETCPHLHYDLMMLKEMGVEAGVVLNPSTPVNTIEHVLHLCSVVLIMTINPGWGGQKLLPEMLDKIKETRKLIESVNSDAKIEVDGGVNETTAGGCRESGAEILVAGTFFFKNNDKTQAVRTLKGL